MAENENNSATQEYILQHRYPADLRTLYVSGAVIAGPISSEGNFVLTFYIDSAAVESEDLEPVDGEPGRYRVKKDGINVLPVREHVAKIMLNQKTMKRLLELLAERVPKEASPQSDQGITEGPT